MVNHPRPGRLSAPVLHRVLAYDILVRLRARGARAGERLSRLALARELGVSRTPIEGAFALLREAGAVDTDGRAVILRNPGIDLERPGPPEGTDAIGGLIRTMARDRGAGSLPDEVSERLLQSRYKASRAVVVDALRQLAGVGAVTRNLGHGWRFMPGYATAEERAAAYRFRMMLEPAGLMEPGFALPEGWTAAMRVRHEAFLVGGAAPDPIPFFETNAAFHRELAEASGNRFLVRAVEQQNQLRRFSNYDWQRGIERIRVSAAEHLGIIDALDAGDREAAAERMHRHLAGTAALPWRYRRP